MFEDLLKALGILVFPLSVFVIAGIGMNAITNRPPAIEELRKELGPLNEKAFGYGKAAFRTFYKDLKADGRKVEKTFLELDLIFPFFYGGALAISLLLVWSMLGRPFNPAWIFVPVVLAVAADWTENLVHLGLTRNVPITGNFDPGAVWVGIASTATIVKIWVLLGSYLSLVWFCGRLVFLTARSE